MNNFFLNIQATTFRPHLLVVDWLGFPTFFTKYGHLKRVGLWDPERDFCLFMLLKDGGEVYMDINSKY